MSAERPPEKLVRDVFTYLPHRIAGNAERIGFLAAKLDEEVAEMRRAVLDSPEFVEELGDIIEVCYALGGFDAIERTRLAKARARGRFEKGIIMRLEDCTDRAAPVWRSVSPGETRDER